jgi:hypothetical protein
LIIPLLLLSVKKIVQNNHFIFVEKKGYLLVILLIFFVAKMIVNFFNIHPDLLRDFQFVYRFIFIFIIVYAFQEDEIFIKNYKRAFLFCLYAFCAFGVVQLVFSLLGVDIIEYNNARKIAGISQVTSFFYEPAVFSQFLIVGLCLFFNSINDLKKSKFLFLLIIINVIAAQSLGGIISFIVWLVYFLSFKLKINFIKVVFISFVLLTVLYAIIFYILPENRVSRFVLNDGIHSEQSAYRRIGVEFITLIEFVKLEKMSDIFLGLDAFESRVYRAKAGLVSFRDGVSGNGIVEYVLRYGVLSFFVMLFVIWNLLNRKMSNFFVFMLFFVLLIQIDGAISKPWIAVYISLLIFSMQENVKKHVSVVKF